MAKKMAGYYEMGLCWFQIARENSCALDEVLTFNQIDWEINFILVSCKGTSTYMRGEMNSNRYEIAFRLKI